MKPYGDDVVNLRAQIAGFDAAVGRFRNAAAGHDPLAAYQPLFEALSWAASIDWRIGTLWVPGGKPLRKAWYKRAAGAEAVPGLRWARNTAAHDWADVLELDTTGRRYPRRYPLRYFEWVWRESHTLPDEASTRDGRDTYEHLLAGQPAEFTLQVLGEVFHFVLSVMEPVVAQHAVEAADG